MAIFSPYGAIEQCRVVIDFLTGKSKGYGFIKYVDKCSGEKAMKELDGLPVENRKLWVAVARRHRKFIRNSNLLVSNLPKDLNNLGLEKLFSPYGKLIECRISKDKLGRCQGVGFVRFELHEHALRALQALDKKRPEMWQEALEVKLAKFRLERPDMGWLIGDTLGHYADFCPETPSSRWSTTPRNTEQSLYDHSLNGRYDNYDYCHDYLSPDSTPWCPGFAYPSLLLESGRIPSLSRVEDYYRQSPKHLCWNDYDARSPCDYSTVVVTNLAEGVDESDLLEIFSAFNIGDCKVVVLNSNFSYAHLYFHNYLNAIEACMLNGMVVRGKRMRTHLIE